MYKQAVFIGLFASFAVLAAEPAKDIAEFELSCSRVNHDGPTQMIHAKVSFDGTNETCSSREGMHIQYNNDYSIEFNCQKPLALFRDTVNTMYAWTLSGKIQELSDRIYQLVLVMDHAHLLASGFAVAPNGLAFPVSCVKW